MLRGRNNPSLQLPWLTLLTGVVAALIFLAPASLVSDLQLDQTALSRGAFWKLLTAHLTHWSFDHLIWDLMMFGIVGTLVEMRSRKVWLLLNLISALVISLSVLIFRPDLQFYRGLSGLDMALAGFWVFTMFQDSLIKGSFKERWMWGVALVLLFSKPLFEMVLGKALFVHSLGAGVENVALAHLVGVVVGVLYGLFAFSTKTRMSAFRLAGLRR